MIIWISFLCVSIGLISFLGYENFLSGTNSPEKPFNRPHVFLTISSIAGIYQHFGFKDTMFEMNWYNFHDEYSDGDWVGIFKSDPVKHNRSNPLEFITVQNISVAGRGYHITSVRYGHPNVTIDDTNGLEGGCLGYWIVYFKSNGNPVASNCFRKYPRWMNQLKDEIGDIPLSYLMIPGTHDAGSIMKYQGSASENVTVRYYVSQEEEFLEQFIYGIRYIDIRVAYYPNTDELFWINHDFVRFKPLHTLIYAIRHFVKATNEIIFMDFHGFPEGFGQNDTAIHDLLVKYVLEEMEDLLVWKDTVPQNPTPNNIWKTRRNVLWTHVVTFMHQRYPFIWPYLTHGWGNKSEITSLERYFEDVAFPSFGCEGKWWSAMAEMTPTQEDHYRYPRKGLRGYAQDVNIPLTYWWMRPDWYSRSMVVSTDFFLGNNIIEIAIQVNKAKAVCSSRLN